MVLTVLPLVSTKKNYVWVLVRLFCCAGDRKEDERTS